MNHLLIFEDFTEVLLLEKNIPTKSRLKRAHDYIKDKCEKSKEKTKRMNENV